jgi:hypothetical protein
VILVAGSISFGIARPLGAQAATQKKPAPAASSAKHVLMNPADLKWGPQPPGLPAGGQAAVVDGDPSKPGVAFTLRAKLPDGYRVPPHWHPTDEYLTIISGSLLAGMGDTLNETATTTLGVGGFAKMPSKMHHFVIAKGATEIQVHGVGPFAITYVNPKDDPRTKTTTSSR